MSLTASPASSLCRLCPRDCGADRAAAAGACGAGGLVRVNLWQAHHGEEPPISGTRGSGTIFFSHCNLRCVYCQNHRISQEGWGRDHDIPGLAGIMLEAAASGVHNLNLVTPTHYSLQIRAALALARERGLALPVVWNSSGYELAETLRAMAGSVDVYLPDLRYAESGAARRYSGAADYPERAREAILEMFRQVGHLRLDDSGLAIRGLLVRLLILPGNVNRVDRSLRWLRDRLGPETAISIMAQYYPTHRVAGFFPELNRTITQAEHDDILDVVESLGFENGFIQELAPPTPEWTPAFREC
ncbi:MAG: radical SAM protein [Desulfobacteraceae bacterium]|nr:radical SAM protein [Desulfobacteraceae bacterium]